jgi:hypothetical protein
MRRFGHEGVAMTAGRQGPRAIGVELPAVTRSALVRRGFAAVRVIADWPEIVGPALADSTMPERLTRTKTGKATLVVRVRPAAALELQHLEPLVIERINSHFGFGAVHKLRLVQGPVTLRPRRKPRPPPPPLPPAKAETLARSLAPIADPELKAALERLGKAVIGKVQRPVPRR